MKKCNLDVNIKAAIIGFWRSGATTEQICGITGIFYAVIQEVINDYKKSEAAH